jgi:hypothetical protein
VTLTDGLSGVTMLFPADTLVCIGLACSQYYPNKKHADCLVKQTGREQFSEVTARGYTDVLDDVSGHFFPCCTRLVTGQANGFS